MRIARFWSLALILALCASLLSAASAPATSTSAFIDSAILADAGYQSVLVHVRPAASLAGGVASAERVGVKIGTRYDAIKVFVAYGNLAALQALATAPEIEALEANSKIDLFTDTSHKATRGQEVLDGALNLAGETIDGRGVGVAVVDSGIDGTHPDLGPNMAGNVKIVCTTPQVVVTSATGGFTECVGPKIVVPAEDTDTISLGGHGTHVAGIVAGTGAASDGKNHGAAPGASLYGVSSGDFLVVENALDGLAWVLENHDQVTPAIKVASNSWGSSYSEYDPENAPFHKATWKLQEALVAAGVTVVFAAGNSGGDGSEPTTSAECINPTPGIICVAAYDDKNSGTRAGEIAEFSSRGQKDQPENWPDISAPGTDIVSTCRITLPVCNIGTPEGEPNHYSTLSGTSMATPHISGIAAQLYQVRPSLTPAGVEDVLEDTAHKFVFGSAYGADPFNPDDTSSFEKGHGLVDVYAAVSSLLGPSKKGKCNPKKC